MEILNVDILGTRYTIRKGVTEKEIPGLSTSDATTDWSSKIIYIREYRKSSGLEDFKMYEKSVIRHEVVHAFLYESGLDSCSERFDEGWAVNEEMVDWIAIQFPKICKVFEQLGVLY